MTDRTITVCGHCLRPSCWSSGFGCLGSTWTGSRDLPEAELRVMAQADPVHFAVELRPGGALDPTTASPDGRRGD